jgi:plasmid stabilization system protein ParE
MRIVYKETFVQRLEKQLQFIAIDNPTAAKRFKKNLTEKIKKIPDNPKIYRKSIYFEDESIRDVIYKGYTVVFRISKNQIEIFGFVKFQQSPTD